MTYTRAQAQFIAAVGSKGLPVDQATSEDFAIAADLIKVGAMTEDWRGLAVNRLTPTRSALASAIEHLSSIDGAGI